jgi:hypothetical protein
VEQGDELSLPFITAAFKVRCKSSAKFVLMALADHANEKGVCWPSIKLLSQKCCVCKTMILRRIRYLEEQGFIEVDRSRNYNVYTLKLVPRVDKTVPPFTPDCPHEGDKPSVTTNLTVKDGSTDPNWERGRDELKLWLAGKGPKPHWV